MKPGTELINLFGEPDHAKMNPGNSPNLAFAGRASSIRRWPWRRPRAGRWACWPITCCTLHVGGTGPNHISADYFAVFADRVQEPARASIGRIHLSWPP